MNKVITLLVLFFFGIGVANAQRKIPFNGLLLDASGAPIKNAHVYIRNPKAYALSTRKGEFGLTDVSGTDTLHILLKKRLYTVPVSGRKSIKITIADEKNIQAEQDQQLIDIGYGFVRRREHTGASETFISGKEMQESGASSIIQALQGRVAGLDVTYEQGVWKCSMRGTRTIMGDSTPLFVLDGFVTPNIDNINVFDIDYVEILKDGSIYGSQGSNGAIVVWTKK